jgi:hypothetical protein
MTGRKAELRDAQYRTTGISPRQVTQWERARDSPPSMQRSLERSHNMPSRRQFLQTTAGAGLLGMFADAAPASAVPSGGTAPPEPLTITGMKVTPIALPDPPILAASGCHGPYFLRNVVEIETDAGVTGIVMTKLDGTARGGILVAIARRRPCGVPGRV